MNVSFLPQWVPWNHSDMLLILVLPWSRPAWRHLSEEMLSGPLSCFGPFDFCALSPVWWIGQPQIISMCLLWCCLVVQESSPRLLILGFDTLLARLCCRDPMLVPGAPQHPCVSSALNKPCHSCLRGFVPAVFMVWNVFPFCRSATPIPE